MKLRKEIRRIREFIRDGVPRVTALKPESPEDAALRDRVVALLNGHGEAMDAATGKLLKEQLEAEEAGDALDEAEDGSVGAYQDLYDGLTIGFLQRKLSGEQVDRMELLERFLGGNSPSAYTRKGTAEMLSTLRGALSFTERFLTADSHQAIATQATEAAEKFGAALARWNAETQEVRGELDALDKLMEQVRIDYRASRHWIEGILIRMRREDELGALLSPLSDVYDSARPSQGDTPPVTDPNTDTPTGDPTTPPEPIG